MDGVLTAAHRKNIHAKMLLIKTSLNIILHRGSRFGSQNICSPERRNYVIILEIKFFIND